MSMKSILPEWYSPDEETIQTVLETGTIALDANVLLDLYRVGRQQRQEILSVLRDNHDRLFVPYQASLEFLRNRLGVVAGIDSLYKGIVDSLEFKQSHLHDIRDPELRREIERLFKRVHGSFAKGVAKLRDEHTISFDEARNNDPVLHELDELLTTNELGQKPTPEALEELKSEAAKRSKAGIPPGYADDANKADASGDYLIWNELMEHAKASGRPLLFVTNDERKGDWYRRVHNQTIGPRPELISEMRRVTSQPYHQTRLSSFLYLANMYLGAEVDDETIATVKNIPRTNTPPAQELSERVDTLASVLANMQTQNQGLGILGDKLAGIGLAGALGKDYFANLGIENLGSVAAGMAAANPGLSFLPPSVAAANQNPGLSFLPSSLATAYPGLSFTPSVAESLADILGREGPQRTLVESLIQQSVEPPPYGTTNAGKSISQEAPAAKTAPPKKAPAKKSPAKKTSAKKAPAKKTAAKKASPTAKVSDQAKKPRKAK